MTPPSEVYIRDYVPTPGVKPTWTPATIGQIVKDQAALVRLGKALFWDADVGGDGNACASCHFEAGVDNRIENAVSPGLNHRLSADPNAAAFPTYNTFQPLPGEVAASAGGRLKTSNFPLRQFDGVSFVDVQIPHFVLPPGFIEGVGNLTPPFEIVLTPGVRPDPTKVSIIDDVISSQGTFTGAFHQTLSPDGECLRDTMDNPVDGVFNATGVDLRVKPMEPRQLFVRKVEPRNTPTVIGACRNKKNFWDGRAKNIFNGVSPHGLADEEVSVPWFDGASLTQKQLAITQQSCASQAVGPVLSTFEMTCAGSSFADVGRKMLNKSSALQKQIVSPDDSVLGALSNATVNPGAAGLSQSYLQMVQAAFQDTVIGGPGQNGYTTAELNFPLIFGLAVAAYEETLDPDQSPFDLTPRHPAPSPDPSALVPVNNAAKPGFLQRGPGTNITLPIFNGNFVLLEGQCFNAQTVRDVNGNNVTLPNTCTDPSQQPITVPNGVVVGTYRVTAPGIINGWTAQETLGIDIFMGNYSAQNRPVAINALAVPGITTRAACNAANTGGPQTRTHFWDPTTNTCLSPIVTVYDEARQTCAEQVDAVPAKIGGCITCHLNPEFTSAAVSAQVAPLPVILPPGTACPLPPAPVVVIDVMPFLNTLTIPPGSPNQVPITNATIPFNMYTVGFYDVGVTPESHDIGEGNLGPFGHPLSFTDQLLTALGRQPQPPTPATPPALGHLPDPLAEAALVDFIGGFADPMLGCPTPLNLTQDPVAPPSLCQIDPKVVTSAAMSSFKTPSLRNVGITSPYFHNGGTLTLKDVAHHYNIGCFFWTNRNLHPECIPRLLSDAEESAIAAFLQNKLTDPRVPLRKAPFDGPALAIQDGYERFNGMLVQDPDSTNGTTFSGLRLAWDKMTFMPAVGATGITPEGVAPPPLPSAHERLLTGADAINNFNSLLSAVLPAARSVVIGQPATAYATLINAGSIEAVGCHLALPVTPSVPASFDYQMTDASNQLVGTKNTPVNIPAGGTVQFMFAITPTAAIDGTDIPIVFDCDNTTPAASHSGLNTFLLSAAATPTPDLIAIGVTPSADGVVRIPGAAGSNYFAAAAINIGGAGSVTATVDTGGKVLPVILTLCQTSGGACLSPPSTSTTATIANNETVTYTVFAQATGEIPFNPQDNRISLRLSSGGLVRGSTNVAVTTQ